VSLERGCKLAWLVVSAFERNAGDFQDAAGQQGVRMLHAQLCQVRMGRTAKGVLEFTQKMVAAQVTKSRQIVEAHDVGDMPAQVIFELYRLLDRQLSLALPCLALCKTEIQFRIRHDPVEQPVDAGLERGIFPIGMREAVGRCADRWVALLKRLAKHAGVRRWRW